MRNAMPRRRGTERCFGLSCGILVNILSRREKKTTTAKKMREKLAKNKPICYNKSGRGEQQFARRAVNKKKGNAEMENKQQQLRDSVKAEWDARRQSGDPLYLQKRKYLHCKCGKQIWMRLFDFDRMPQDFAVYCTKCLTHFRQHPETIEEAERRAADSVLYG